MWNFKKAKNLARPTAVVFLAAMILALGAFFRSGVAADPAPATDPPNVLVPTRPVTEIRLSTKRNVAPGPHIRMYVNTRNLARIEVSVYRMDTAKWLRIREESDNNGEFKPMPEVLPGKPVRVFPVTVGDPKLKSSPQQPDIYRSKQFNLPVLPPGAYLLVASGGGEKAWSVVNITNLAVVLKRAPGTLLTWVTDHASGVPIAGATVTVWDRAAKKTVSEGRTDKDGIYRAGARPDGSQTVIVARNVPGRQSDLAGLPLPLSDPDNRLVSHLQTDRPVYRPGATVSYRAILRRTKGTGYIAEANASVTAEVRDSRDNVQQQTKETTSPLGTVAGSFSIPAQGALGPYSLVLTTGDGQRVYATFTVAEYRKPDFLATVTPEKKRYLSGETGKFALQTNYYFGAPLPGATVRYVIRRSASPYYGAFGGGDPAETAWFASGDGNLYARDTYAADDVVADNTITTDAEGRASISFPTRTDVGDSAYSISCTVTDGQRREVTASGSVPVYGATVRLGIRTKVYTAPLNGIVPVELRLADLDGRPVAGRVTLLTRQQIYDEKTQASSWRTLSQSAAVVPASGKATTNVPAAREGEVEIRATVTDSAKRKAVAVSSFYVTAPDTPTPKERPEPTVRLRLGASSYQPGDTVTVFLTANTPERSVLLTVEGNALFAYKVVPPGKTGFTWKVPATAGMAPNAHVSAAQWAAMNGDPANKTRAVRLLTATVPLPVPDRSRRLDLSVTPDRPDHRPGDRVIYTVRARDGKTGKPVGGAEVALAVIDEAIFAVRPDATPDIYGTFWGFRENHTHTAASAPEEVSGGAYQNAEPTGVAPVRQRFLDTAFWNARLVTGPDGTAVATVELPGNLTAWRATALGVTDSTAVGRALSRVNSSRPVMLRLATPRQFVQGDRLTLIGTVSNRTEQKRTFKVTLTATGVQPAPGENAMKSVTIPAKGEATVEWRVSADSIPVPDGRATLEGTLIAADLEPGETLTELSDRVRVSVPVRPRGVAATVRVGGAVSGDAETSLSLDLPAGRIEPATELRVTVRGGAGATARSDANRLYKNSDYGTLGAADLLLVAATPGAPPADPAAVRDALALLSRGQTPQGAWGWWDDAPADARITARVLRALSALKRSPQVLPASVPFPENLLKRGVSGGNSLYREIGLWEDRAYLAPALAALSAEAAPYLAEVADRNAGTLSPAATLVLAKGLLEAGNRDRARKLTRAILAQGVTGPETIYIPAGERPGQRAGVLETTARALETLVALGEDAPTQTKLARWLLLPSDGEGRPEATSSEEADIVRALLLYSRAQGNNTQDGSVMPSADSYTLTVNGVAVPWGKRAPGTENLAPLAASVPRDLLKDGANAIRLKRLESAMGEAFISAEALVYRTQEAETAAGMRVLRRFESQNEYGVWGEVLPDTRLRPGSPVRVTVVVWPNETADALKIIEPLPAGFEFVDSERGGNAREEVRDGALLHYLPVTSSEPVTFRYYLRSESEGTLMALPATGELIRRPAIRGGSAAQVLDVRDTPKEKTP
ncbi:MAG: hypothetical protein H8F28_21085 [Fibrella sp.]|nr:hypothetical protein [Armatimonadota bacterium]